MNVAPSRRTRGFAEFLPAECMMRHGTGREQEHDNCDRWPQESRRGWPRLLSTARGFLRPVQPRHAVPELARAVRNRVRPRARRPRSNHGAWRADQNLLRVASFEIDVEAELGGLEATQLPYRGRLVRSWARTSCGCARIPRGEIGGGDDDRLRENQSSIE